MRVLRIAAKSRSCQATYGYLVDQTVLKALGLGNKLLGAAVSVARGCGVADQIPVIHLKDDRLDQPCKASSSYECAISA